MVAPDDVAVRREYAAALRAAQRPPAALEQAFAAVTVATSLSEKISGLAWVLSWATESSQHDWLEQQLDEARQREPARRDTWTRCLVYLLRATGQPESARRELVTLSTAHPADSEILGELVTLSLTTGNLADAIGYQQQRVVFDRSPAQLEQLARLYRQANQPEAAAKIWDQLLSQPASEDETLQLLGELLDRRDLFAAQQIAEAGSSRFPNSWRLAYRAALIHFALDQDDEARLTLAELLQRPMPRATRAESLSDDLQLLELSLSASRFFSQLETRRLRSGMRHVNTLEMLFDRDESLAPASSSLAAAQIYGGVGLIRMFGAAAINAPIWPVRPNAKPLSREQIRSRLAAAWATQQDELGRQLAVELIGHSTDADPATRPSSVAALVQLLTPPFDQEDSQDYLQRLAGSYRGLQAAYPDHTLDLHRVYAAMSSSAKDPAQLARHLASELPRCDSIEQLAHFAPLLTRLTSDQQQALAAPFVAHIFSLLSRDVPPTATVSQLRQLLQQMTEWQDFVTRQPEQGIAPLLQAYLRMRAMPPSEIAEGDADRQRTRGRADTFAGVASQLSRYVLAEGDRVTALRQAASGRVESAQASRQVAEASELLARLKPDWLGRLQTDPTLASPTPTAETGLFPAAGPRLGEHDVELLKRIALVATNASSRNDLLAALTSDDADETGSTRLTLLEARAALLWWWDRQPEAIGLLEQAVENSTDSPSLRLGLARAYLQHGELVKARDALQAAASSGSRTSDLGGLQEQLWDRWSEQVHWRDLRGHAGAVSALATDPQGRWLASAGVDGRIRIWGVDNGQLVATLDGHRDIILSLAFSPDGNELASAGYDRAIRRWRADTWQPAGTLTGHNSTVRSVQYAPSGKQLASAGDDRLVRIWDVASGRCLESLAGHTDSIYVVRFDQAANRVVSSGNDQTVQWWDLDRSRLLRSIPITGGPIRARTTQALGSLGSGRRGTRVGRVVGVDGDRNHSNVLRGGDHPHDRGASRSWPACAGTRRPLDPNLGFAPRRGNGTTQRPHGSCAGVGR